MANEFVIKNGFHSKDASQINGFLGISGSLIFNSAHAINYYPQGSSQFFLLQPLDDGSTNADRSGSVLLLVPGYNAPKDEPNFHNEKLQIITRVNDPKGQVTFSGSQVVFQYPTASFVGLPSGSQGYPHSTINVITYDSASGQLYFTGSSAIGSTSTLQQVTTAGNSTTNVIQAQGGIDFSNGSDISISQNAATSVLSINTAEEDTTVEIKGFGNNTNAKFGDSTVGIQLTSSAAGVKIKGPVNITGPITASVLKPLNQPGLSVTGTTLLVQGGDNVHGTGGNGGALNLFGGKSRSQGNGGDVNIFGGDFNASGTSGSVYLDGNGIFANPSLNTNTLKNYAGTQVLVSQSAAGATTIHGNNSGGTQIFESGESLFQISRKGSPYVATISASNNQYESRVIATYGRFSEIEGGSPLVINVGTSTLKISASNFNVSTTGEMSSGTGDGISTTNITSSGNISSSGTITGNSFVGSGTNLTGVRTIATKEDGSSVNTTTDTLNFTGNAVSLSDAGGGSVTVTVSTASSAAFPFTGDAQITGSLNISGSIGLTDGRNNVLLGEEAGKNLTTGTNSVMVGYGAGADSTLDTESNFVFIGYQAGSGSIAGYGASGGSVYIGSQAGAGSDTNPGIGFGNTAIGYQTGYKANIQYSTGIGYGVFSNVDGNGNEDVAIGYNAMNRVAGGSTQNVAIGNSSLKGYNTSYFSNRNTAVGYFTGKELVNSHDNVLLGWKAGEDLSTSAGPSNYGGNIFIGTLAGDNIGTGYNNIHLGPGLSGNSADIGQVKIGSGSAILISGSITTGDLIFANTASAPNFSGSFQGDGSNLTGVTVSGVLLASNNLSDLASAGDARDNLGLGSAATTAANAYLAVSNNLSDLNNAGTARTNLGLGTAAQAATGISNTNVPVFTSGVADDDFLRVNGTSIEGLNASEVKTALGVGDAFPFTGDAQITGSLIISASNNTSQSLEVQGSGSTIFKVEGSVGTLFSVDDGLDNVIFAANNISGTPVISANADNTVKLGKLGGFGIVISGSTPAPTNDAAKIIMTGSLFQKGSTAFFSSSMGVGTSAQGTIGRIDASNDVVAFSTSDERLKDNITPIEDALNKVSQVQGIEFDWVEKEGIHGNEGHDVGVIAQEIEKVLPEVVTTRDNGYKAVKYEKIIPLLVEAIKELQKEIQELKSNK